jgi:hypothetical protein
MHPGPGLNPRSVGLTSGSPPPVVVIGHQRVIPTTTVPTRPCEDNHGLLITSVLVFQLIRASLLTFPLNRK